MAKFSKKAQKRWSMVAIIIVIVAVAVLVVLLLSTLFQNREQRVTDTSVNTSVSTGVLDCTASSPEGALFVAENPREVEHEIKVSYQGTKADKFFYTYEAEFTDAAGADDAEARIHSDYNLYMGSYMDDFDNSFAANGDEMKAQVFAAASDLGSYTARVFLMSPEEFEQFDGKYEIADLEKFYEGKGFRCEMDD